MNSKTEDKILIILSIIFGISFFIMFIVGFQIYEDKWNTYYMIGDISLFTFFIFSLLSLLIKKKNSRSK